VQLRPPSLLNIVVDGVAERKTGMRQIDYPCTSPEQFRTDTKLHMEASTDVAAIGGTYFGLKGKYFMTNFQTWISDNSSIMGRKTL
jgi:hypothetical protein